MRCNGLCVFGLIFTFRIVLCNLDSVFGICCSLGQKKALDPLKCESRTVLPDSVSADQQNICLSAIDLCCFQYLRDNTCKHGKQAAKSKANCTEQRTTDIQITFRYCCEACKLGIISGTLSVNCELKTVHFGSPWDEVYTSCCADTISRNFNGGPKVYPKENNCEAGFKYDIVKRICSDINECENEDFPCESNEICENTRGSYQCSCVTGFQRDPVTAACIDINECQLSSHDCTPVIQRCDNTIGSFHCVRAIGCGTGYTLNAQTGNCEDDNECLLGIDDCRSVGMECRNTPGSFRCEKKRCYFPNCTRVCSPGFELGGNGTCVDINECRNVSTCSRDMKCINTIGSFQCIPRIKCTEGLRLNNEEIRCIDVDECVEQPGICDHICTNLWGSFKCDCRKGFSLHQDNRSCVDKNECEIYRERRPCMDTCINIPGSYRCQCPEGYKLLYGAFCQDIDECVTENKCIDPNEVCVNTKGSYRCHKIICPQNYERDINKKNRCFRASYYCQYDSEECSRTPQSYSFHFISLPSNFPVPSGGQSFFTINTTASSDVNISFSFELKNVRTPAGIPKVTVDYFTLERVSWNMITVTLCKTIVGPQEIELQLKTQYLKPGVSSHYTLSHLFLFVSQYQF